MAFLRRMIARSWSVAACFPLRSGRSACRPPWVRLRSYLPTPEIQTAMRREHPRLRREKANSLSFLEQRIPQHRSEVYPSGTALNFSLRQRECTPNIWSGRACDSGSHSIAAHAHVGVRRPSRIKTWTGHHTSLTSATVFCVHRLLWQILFVKLKKSCCMWYICVMEMYLLSVVGGSSFLYCCHVRFASCNHQSILIEYSDQARFRQV